MDRTLEMLAAKMRIWKEYDLKTRGEDEEGSLGASNASLFLEKDKKGKYMVDAPDLFNKTHEYLKKVQAMATSIDALNTNAPLRNSFRLGTTSLKVSFVSKHGQAQSSVRKSMTRLKGSRRISCNWASLRSTSRSCQ